MGVGGLEKGVSTFGRHALVALGPQPATNREFDRWALKRYKFYTYTSGAAALEFEYDEAKGRSNKVKYGIDFAEVRTLWLDERFIEVRVRTETEDVALYEGQEL